MKVLIFHITLRRSGARGRKGTVVEVERLTVGRGTDNALHVPGLTVALHHCVFVKRPDGIALELVDGRDLRVNGAVTNGQLVRAGDVVSVGQHEIRVLDTESSTEDLILEVEATAAAASGTLRAKTRIGVERGFVSRRVFSWALASFVLLVVLGLPLLQRAFDPVAADVVHPRPRAQAPIAMAARLVETGWSSGPLARNHSHLETDCAACHVGGFVRVRDQECTACHATVGRHTAEDVRLDELESVRCADCHREHQGDAGLLQAGLERCTSCHGDLKRRFGETMLLDVRSLAAHPEVRPAIVVEPISADRVRVSLADLGSADGEDAIRERSGLAFSHTAHLAPGLAGADGEPVDLGCGDCHVADAGGELMQPIEFERHCQSCHGLEFDRGSDRQAPHENVETVRRAIVEFYASLALGAGPSGPARRKEAPPPEDRPGAKAWVEERATAAQRRLLGSNGACALCHTFEGEAGAAKVVPVVVPPNANAPRWFVLARFEHGPHELAGCTSCHDVSQASDSGAVAIPGIEVCRNCHGDGDTTGEVASSCITCHGFHHPEAGTMVTAIAAPAPAEAAEPTTSAEPAPASEPTAGAAPAPAPETPVVEEEPAAEEAPATPVPAPAALIGSGFVEEGTKLYASPGGQGTVIGDFEGRVAIEILESRDGWLRVRAPLLSEGSIQGWIPSEAAAD
jgi:predicted CXXCH cytochrome family protein